MDARLRDIERAAKAGDVEASARFYRELLRTGLLGNGSWLQLRRPRHRAQLRAHGHGKGGRLSTRTWWRLLVPCDYRDVSGVLRDWVGIAPARLPDDHNQRDWVADYDTTIHFGDLDELAEWLVTNCVAWHEPHTVAPRLRAGADLRAKRQHEERKLRTAQQQIGAWRTKINEAHEELRECTEAVSILAGNPRAAFPGIQRARLTDARADVARAERRLAHARAKIKEWHAAVRKRQDAIEELSAGKARG